MKVCRASSFQKRSSDVPEPLLPLTQKDTYTHTVQKTKATVLDEKGWGGQNVRSGVGRVGFVTGAEEDAVPLHPNTVQLYSNHILTGLFKCSCLLRGQSVYGGWVGRENGQGLL